MIEEPEETRNTEPSDEGTTKEPDRRIPPILFGIAIAVLLISVSMGGVAFAGYRYEQAHASVLLPGVSVAGVDVGGMTREEAEDVVAPTVSAVLDRKIHIRAGEERWVRTARQLGVRASVQRALDRAVAYSNELGWTSRLLHRLLNRPVEQNFDMRTSLRTGAIDGFVRNVADRVRVQPRNAALDFIDGGLVKQRAKVGRSLDEAAARKAIVSAVRQGKSSVALGFTKVLPKVTEKNLGKLIVVRLSENRLYLYDGLDLAAKFSVATGQPKYPTPQGHFSIINKRINPTWVNPAKKTWGKKAPDFIPPGPDNPLGTRALDLNAPGIRIHGTPDDASIGHYASHGCIRMHISDSEDLFGRVGVGTPVVIAW